MSPTFVRNSVRRPPFAVSTVTVRATPNTERFPMPFRPITLRPRPVVSVPSSTRLSLPIRRYLSTMSSRDIPVPSSFTTILDSVPMPPSGSRISTVPASASHELATISDMTGCSLPCRFIPRPLMTAGSISMTRSFFPAMLRGAEPLHICLTPKDGAGGRIRAPGAPAQGQPPLSHRNGEQRP